MATVTRGRILRGDLANWDGKTATATRLDATGGTITGLAVGNEVDVLQVYGEGTNRTRGTIANAVQKIGSTVCTLVFAPGTWTIDDNQTIPSNFTCHVAAGCVFSVSSGKTLTFSGRIFRESSTWTGGAGTVVYGAGPTGVYYDLITAETTAGLSLSDINEAFPVGHAQRYGFSTSGTAAANATALQKAINAVAHAGHGVVFIPRGNYLLDASEVYFYYHVSSNPNFPSSTNRQGNITLVGEGFCDLNAFDNSIDQGTIIDVVGDTLTFGNGTLQMRGCRLENLTVVGNSTGYVVKWSLASRGTGFDLVSIIQEGTGGGVEMDDCFSISCGFAYIYTPNGSNAGTGFYLHNSSQAAGEYNLTGVNCVDFSKNWVLGQESTLGSSMNGVMMRGCQGNGGAYNLVIGTGVKASVIDGFHNEGATTLGILVAYGATNIEFRACYSSNAGASADYMSIGQNSGVAAEQFTRNIRVANCQFTGITNSGIQYFSASSSMNTKIEFCTFLGSGSETGIEVENASAHGLTIGPNYYASLGTEVTNSDKANVLHDEDTLGRSTYQSAQTFAGHAETLVAVASATDIAWIDTSNLWRISGTTTINTIATPTSGNPRITLLFTTSLTVNDASTSSGNLQLSGGANFSATANDILELVWHSNSSEWVECSRSVN